MFNKKGDKDEPTRTEPENHSGTDAEKDTGTGAGEGAGEGTSEGLGSVKLPDVIGKVLGFKIFKVVTEYQSEPEKNRFGATRVDTHCLQSPYRGNAWTRGYMNGVVGKQEGGVYAWHKPRKSMTCDGGDATISFRGTHWNIPAAVLAWGEIEVYETGFRAEHMQVVLLAYCDEWRYRDVVAYSKWAAENYGAAISNESDLWKDGLTLGSPVPNELRPARTDIDRYFDGL